MRGLEITFRREFTAFVTKPFKERQKRLDDALRHAIYDGDVEQVKIALKQGAKTETTDFTGFTMLHTAAVRDNADVVEALLAGGADITAVTKQGMTAMHLAARSGYPNVLKCLAGHGADPNLRDHNNDTPMRLAVFYAHGDAAVALLGLGAKPDMKYLNQAQPQENVDRNAWVDALARLNSAFSLTRAHHLKYLRRRMNLRIRQAATP